MKPVTNTQELNERLAQLPAFSRQVYDTLMEGLYAEPGFSDVTALLIAKRIPCPVKAVNAAIGHLIEMGLVETEEWETMDNPKQTFIHSFEHDREIPRNDP